MKPTHDPAVRGLVSKGPARRQSIARAAVRILRVSGIEGLTHRAVAAEAQVSQGSTTYYFTSRNDLLNAAIEYSTQASIRWLQEWGAAHKGQELAVVLPRMVYAYLTEHRASATLDAEMYVLAARRPELRMHTSRWTTSFVDVLADFVDRDTASHLTATVNGLVLIAVSADRAVTLEEISDTLLRGFRTPDGT